MSSKIKRIDREIAYKGKILEVYRDLMEIDGKESEWDYIHHKGGGAVVPILEDGRILLVRQFRNAIDGYSLELPGGAFDTTDEPGEICARRELLQETGYLAGKMKWLVSIHSMIAFCDEKVDIYLAKELKKQEQNMDEEEEIELISYSLEEVVSLLREGKITDSKTVAGLFAYISGRAGI